MSVLRKIIFNQARNSTLSQLKRSSTTALSSNKKKWRRKYTIFMLCTNFGCMFSKSLKKKSKYFILHDNTNKSTYSFFTLTHNGKRENVFQWKTLLTNKVTPSVHVPNFSFINWCENNSFLSYPCWIQTLIKNGAFSMVIWAQSRSRSCRFLFRFFSFFLFSVKKRRKEAKKNNSGKVKKKKRKKKTHFIDSSRHYYRITTLRNFWKVRK